MLTDCKSSFLTNKIICSGENKERLAVIVHRNSLTMSNVVKKACLSEFIRFKNILWIFSYNKSQRDALFSKFIFDKGLYIFRTDLLSIIRSLNTVYTAIGICHASYVNCLLVRSGWNSS